MKGLLAGRYELGPLIAGGPGIVLRRAHDTVLDRPVALRLVTADAPPEMVTRERDNVRALARLHHPGLVCLRDGGVDRSDPGADLLFVVTDPVDGPTLAGRLAAGPLPVSRLRAWAVELADALAHLHAAGMVHGALEPSDVLVDGGHARLTGFPAIRVPEREAPAPGRYAAPEQLRGGPPSAGGDIHALGAVIRAAIGAVPAGRLPEVLDAMTATDPADRPTAAEASADLAAAVLPAEPAVAPDPVAVPAPRVPDVAQPVPSRAVPRRGIPRRDRWPRLVGVTGRLSAVALVAAAVTVAAVGTASAVLILGPAAAVQAPAVAVPLVDAPAQALRVQTQRESTASGDLDPPLAELVPVVAVVQDPPAPAPSASVPDPAPRSSAAETPRRAAPTKKSADRAAPSPEKAGEPDRADRRAARDAERAVERAQRKADRERSRGHGSGRRGK